MCSVIGFYNPNPKKEEFEKLLRVSKQSKIRGLHAFGLIYRVPHEGILFSKSTNVNEFLIESVLERVFEKKPTHILGHFRYSTSGDWREEKNNQPIMSRDWKAGIVFNGVIDMGTKEEMESKYGQSFWTSNDGEIFLRKVLNGEGVEDWVSKGKFSFAGGFMDQTRAFFIRNKNRPLWSLREESVFVTSTKDILVRAGFDKSLAKPVPTGKIVNLEEL